ncbi:hypothetical protein [Amycolatopsis sp. SID8362]|uniref:hypothetical protein n=1 Tax=Amycolatopsis sp. SID8362 TaxID=2690346 RepID=UPI0013712619|nr:hypothetical protein [Amycolatopsis sp. SID8362]NBH05298.1 hypothetical protein [Amycolatopsis sp. SID8362]NED41998.1 hypothetical protein [Amycolatopsis sp. SID8362]
MEQDPWGLGRAELARERERLGTVALRTTACCLAWIPALAFLLFSYGIGDASRNTAAAVLAFGVIVASLGLTPWAVLWWLRYESVRRTGWRAAEVTAVRVEPRGCLAALAFAGRSNNAGSLDYVVRYRDGGSARLRGGASLRRQPPLVAFEHAQPAWVGGSGRAAVVLFATSRWGPRRPRAVPATFTASP